MQVTDPNVELEKKLKEFFGYNTFRSYQKEIIKAVLESKDVMAILPTGAGKSLCYQLPALIMPGTAIVVSPLISLMQDQVVSLFKNGIQAAFLNSSLHYQDIQDVLNHLEDYKLLYVAPERFADPQFIEKLKQIKVSFFVVDEAHCISQWGHSFRGEYRKLSVLKQTFPDKAIIALTATATPEVQKDIMSQLEIVKGTIIKGSFNRPNLTIRMNTKIDANQQLIEFIKDKQKASGIVYAATRKTVDATYAMLEKQGFKVGRYHAGMTDQERSLSQQAFLHDEVTWMVATVAFGMGIHKPDIRYIVHTDMPRTIEQYYQEIGRAGRDGLPAECLMLYGPQDFVLYNLFLEDVEDVVVRKQMKDKIGRMYRLSSSVKCRKSELLLYFGESPSFSTCTTCDNCLDDVELVEGTVIAQKILSCVFRLQQNFGMRHVIDVLRGSKNQLLISRGHHQLSTYGLLAELSDKEVRYYIDSLIYMGFLQLTEGEYPVLKWTEQSQSVIKREHVVYFRKKIFKEAKVKNEASLEFDQTLFEELRQLRYEIAQKEKVPPYVVFSDRSLQEMALHYPRTKQEFSRINGVGPIKWVKYGEEFSKAIQTYYERICPIPLLP